MNTKNTPQSQSSQESQDSHKKQDSARSDAADDRPAPMEVLRQARAQLGELTGLTPQSVSSFEQTEDGWSLDVEVLELSRVPDTMSLMASYRVDLDPRGQVTGYRRVRRYERGRADARPPGGR
ncbi:MULTISPECIES: gas vesicle protein [unclassified Streptomyces]|uniref:gas vesicle protein GvpO n=1 Tax=unclassified Streptomyces TaxID=2593676 RepID=UPI0011A8FF9A|nr:gas vesicle protein [Streptomyces sp. BK340]TVZ81751.1 gas vesicle protein GvpO [Streptomyces sp. BK340]